MTTPFTSTPSKRAGAATGGRNSGMAGGWLRWRSVWPATALLPVAGAIWFVHRFDPTDGTREVTGPCAWHALTGINGPTCGGTRAFYYLVHGDLVDAFRFHAPFAIAAPFLAYWWLAWGLNTWFGIRLPQLRPRRWMIITFAVGSCPLILDT